MRSTQNIFTNKSFQYKLTSCPLCSGYIVAASRARLGFFILGSTAAVETGSNGKPILHWSKLLEHLRTPRPNEMSRPARTMHGEHPNVSSNSQNQSRAESRVGSSITLCCPRHKDTSKLIQCPSDFPQNSTWSSFCSLPCNFRLSWCNHSCSLSCHSPQKQPHTAPSDCTHPLARPCPDHSDVPLLCGSLYSSSAGTNLDEALEHFPCDQPVKYERPECAHVVILQCHERTELENAGLSGFSLELCSEIVGDFVSFEYFFRIQFLFCIAVCLIPFCPFCGFDRFTQSVIMSFDDRSAQKGAALNKNLHAV